MRGDAGKVRGIRQQLLALVTAGDLAGAYALLDATIGDMNVRGWGGPLSSTADLMQRIMAIRPGAEGVELAVNALCGEPVYGPKANVWTQARYEQDLDDWRKTDFIVGIRWEAQEWSCKAAKRKAGCYRLADAPPFEMPGCDFEERETQCCCAWYQLFEGSDPPSPWRK